MTCEWCGKRPAKEQARFTCVVGSPVTKEGTVWIVPVCGICANALRRWGGKV